MAEYTNIFGDNQVSALQENIQTLLELVSDPRGRKNKSNFIYQTDPRVKSSDFGSYPIIYVENYSVTNEGVNTGGNLFNKTFKVEFHAVIEDDSVDQKKWHDELADELTYKFDYSERQNLAEQGIGQPSIVRNQRFPGIDVADQPVIRREFEVEAGTQIDMEQVGGNNPYGS